MAGWGGAMMGSSGCCGLSVVFASFAAHQAGTRPGIARRRRALGGCWRKRALGWFTEAGARV
jgi:hypothetical protein